MLVLLARPSVVCRACRAVPARPLAVALAPSHPHPRTRTAPALVPTALRHHRLHPEHTRAVHLSAAASSPAAQTTVGPSSSVAAESVPDPGRVVDTALVHAPEAPAEPAVTEGAPAHISLTARAADRLGGALAADLTQGALRLAVEPGGCHGYQYKIALDAEQDEDDLYVFLVRPRARWPCLSLRPLRTDRHVWSSLQCV